MDEYHHRIIIQTVFLTRLADTAAAAILDREDSPRAAFTAQLSSTADCHLRRYTTVQVLYCRVPPYSAEG